MMKKKFFMLFPALFCVSLLWAAAASGYSNVNQGCMASACHAKEALHEVSEHDTCANCHASPSGGDQQVTPNKCAACHPRDNPGACNLVKLSDHSAQNCTSCHTDCAQRGSCPAEEVLGDDDERLETLRQFRDRVFDRSALGRRMVSIYYRHAPAIKAALEKHPALKAFARKALEVFVPVAEKRL